MSNSKTLITVFFFFGGGRKIAILQKDVIYVSVQWVSQVALW